MISEVPGLAVPIAAMNVEDVLERSGLTSMRPGFGNFHADTDCGERRRGDAEDRQDSGGEERRGAGDPDSSEEVFMKKYSDVLAGWLAELGYTHCFVAGGNIVPSAGKLQPQ